MARGDFLFVQQLIEKHGETDFKVRGARGASQHGAASQRPACGMCARSGALAVTCVAAGSRA